LRLRLRASSRLDCNVKSPQLHITSKVNSIQSINQSHSISFISYLLYPSTHPSAIYHPSHSSSPFPINSLDLPHNTIVYCTPLLLSVCCYVAQKEKEKRNSNSKVPQIIARVSGYRASQTPDVCPSFPLLSFPRLALPFIFILRVVSCISVLSPQAKSLFHSSFSLRQYFSSTS
jgi:hypothetical protein